MAEIKNAAPDQEFNDDGSKNPDYVAPIVAGEKTPEQLAEEERLKKEGEKKEEGFDDDIEKNPPKPPVRESIAQHIITRKNEKIKKLESKLKEGDDGYVPPEDEEDSGLTEEARGAVDKAVDKKIAPILSKMITDADENELKALFTNESESKKYEKHIRAYMEHEAYKGVAPSVIYHHLAFTNALAIGAKKKKVADLEANQNRGGGRILSPKGTILGDLPSAEEISDMSEADFEKMETDARQGKYLK